ncbi:MAG: pyruvate kinase [Limisphaerales bacterium]
MRNADTSDIWKVPDVMATIGPTLEKPEDLRAAILAGAGWFRFPCGYRQRPHVENARAVRAASAEVEMPVKLLLDLPSSRPRTGNMQELRMSPGDKVVFWDPECCSDGPKKNGALPVPLPGLTDLLRKLGPQQRMWFCDGRINFVVEEVRDATIRVRLVQAAVPLKSSNSLFLPDSSNPFTAITKEDRRLLQSFADHKLLPDWVALSLIASPEDVRAGRQEVREHLGNSVRIMAKFETVTAVECAEDIIQAADGIMVARGDLGLAVGYVRLPEAQEYLVAAARQAGKPVVVATQVMEGFAETGVPQRAELSDLSLIARQRADAVMLGKETVFSKRPIDCIRFATEILAYETRRFEKSSNLASMESLDTEAVTA